MQRRISNTNCEWFHRPDYAISEMSASVVNNWKYVQENLGKMATSKVLAKLDKHMKVLTKPLSKLNSKDINSSKNPEQDLNDLFAFMKDSKANVSGKVVSAFMEEARHVGSAMLLMSSWYQCSKYVIDNPNYSKRFVSSRNGDLKRFRKDPSRKQFVKDSVNCFLQYNNKKSKVAAKKESKSHYLQLLVTSDEDSDNDERRDNVNETASEQYTSSDDASVSSAESEQEKDRPIISKSNKSKKTLKHGRKNEHATNRKCSSSSSSDSDDEQVEPIIAKSDKIKTKKTKGKKKANSVTRNTSSSSSDSEVVRKVKRKNKRVDEEEPIEKKNKVTVVAANNEPKDNKDGNKKRKKPREKGKGDHSKTESSIGALLRTYNEGSATKVSKVVVKKK